VNGPPKPEVEFIALLGKSTIGRRLWAKRECPVRAMIATDPRKLAKPAQ